MCTSEYTVVAWKRGLALGTRAPDFLPLKKTPSNPFSLALLSGTTQLAARARSPALPHVLVLAVSLGTCEWQGWVPPGDSGKAAAVSQESASPYCHPTIVPATLREKHKAQPNLARKHKAQPNLARAGVDSPGESPSQITSLVISKHSQKPFVYFSFFFFFTFSRQCNDNSQGCAVGGSLVAGLLNRRCD